VWEELKTVYDPEIPASIVDLGLVYHVAAQQEEDGVKVLVTMTLTAPGCGVGPVLVEDVRSKIARVPGVSDVDVQLVFDPPWDMSMMSEAAKLTLGIM
jgi:probable FeS assembly SUF system protein SufT